jgi:hypothetical protein
VTIEIISSEKIEVDETTTVWSVWLEITQVAQTWALPTTAPDTLAEADLQAYFDAREADLWGVAQTKQHPPNIYDRPPLRRVLKAFAAVVLDEINILRQQHLLPDRTAEQLVTAIKSNL